MLLAAEQGDNRARNDIGHIYEKGLGREVDLDLAMNWYRRAAEDGLGFAMSNVGRLHEEGLGVEPDLVAAADWYRRSATDGSRTGMFNLGRMHEDGTGVEQSDVLAAMLFFVAEEKGHEDAGARLAGLEAQMSEPDIQKARALAAQCLAGEPENCIAGRE